MGIDRLQANLLKIRTQDLMKMTDMKITEYMELARGQPAAETLAIRWELHMIAAKLLTAIEDAECP